MRLEKFLQQDFMAETDLQVIHFLECVVCAYEVALFLKNTDLSFDLPSVEKFKNNLEKYEQKSRNQILM